MENPFETMAGEYDAWFEANPALFEAELRAIRAVLPHRTGLWVEIGVGTGQFASRLGIPVGVEPAAAMGERAGAQGIRVIAGKAECLPLPSGSVDAAFYITTLCFVSDVDKALSEARRIVRPRGCVIVGILPRDSEVGRRILANPTEPFFRNAQLLTPDELERALVRTGFAVDRVVQTLTSLSRWKRPEEPREGAGQGSFVVMRGTRVCSEPVPGNLDRMNPTSVGSSP